MKLTVKEEVYDDLADIVNWYENQSAGFGEKFLNEWENTLKFVARNPSAFQTQFKSFRHAKVIRFPYLVIFEIDTAEVIVYMVIHTSRKPGKRYRIKRKK